MASESEDANFVENHHRINRILLSLLKLWPYQRSKFTKITHAFHFAILLSYIFFQLTSFFTYQLTMDSFVMVFSYAVPSFIYLIQYYSFYARLNEVKQIWKDIHDSWSVLRNEKERNIMRQYSSTSVLCTILLTLTVTTCIIVYAFIIFSPIILDMMFPLNETRPRQLQAFTEYFVDERTYFYLISCHWLTGTILGSYVILATGTLQLVYIEYICGLLRIASYRIEHLLDEHATLNVTQIKNRTASQNINAAVGIHQKALEYSKFFTNTFAPTFFLMIAIGVASLSLNLLRLLRAITSLNNLNELIISIIFVSVHFLLMFLANYYGQRITDHNNEIFHSVYNTQWYIASGKIRKLLLFVMENTTKTYVINIGHLIGISIENFAKVFCAMTFMQNFTTSAKIAALYNVEEHKNYYLILDSIYNISIEGFTSLVSMTISYFTMIYSTQ